MTDISAEAIGKVIGDAMTGEIRSLEILIRHLARRGHVDLPDLAADYRAIADAVPEDSDEYPAARQIRMLAKILAAPPGG